MHCNLSLILLLPQLKSLQDNYSMINVNLNFFAPVWVNFNLLEINQFKDLLSDHIRRQKHHRGSERPAIVSPKFHPNVLQTATKFPEYWKDKMQHNVHFHPLLLCEYQELRGTVVSADEPLLRLSVMQPLNTSTARTTPTTTRVQRTDTTATTADPGDDSPIYT